MRDRRLRKQIGKTLKSASSDRIALTQQHCDLNTYSERQRLAEPRRGSPRQLEGHRCGCEVCQDAAVEHGSWTALPSGVARFSRAMSKSCSSFKREVKNLRKSHSMMLGGVEGASPRRADGDEP